MPDTLAAGGSGIAGLPYAAFSGAAPGWRSGSAVLQVTSVYCRAAEMDDARHTQPLFWFAAMAYGLVCKSCRCSRAGFHARSDPARAQQQTLSFATMRRGLSLDAGAAAGGVNGPPITFQFRWRAGTVDQRRCGDPTCAPPPLGWRNNEGTRSY